MPVKIKLAEALRGRVSQIYFVIDDNPSPLPAASPSVRSPIRARSRRGSGSTTTPIFMPSPRREDGRSMRPSASSRQPGAARRPAGKDQELAMRAPRPDEDEPRRAAPSRLAGRGASPGQPSQRLRHADGSGDSQLCSRRFRTQRQDPLQRRAVLSVESDISISEDPSFTFEFVPSARPASSAPRSTTATTGISRTAWPVKAEPGT